MRIGDADKIGRRTDKHSITCLHENQLQVSDGASVFKFGGVSCSFSAATSLGNRGGPDEEEEEDEDIN